MADKPQAAPADPSTQPGGSHFDVDHAPEADYARHRQILQRRKEVADLSAPPAGTTTPPPVLQSPGFSAPSAPLIPKYDTLTQQVQQLPQKLWDMLSDEDKSRFTDYHAEAPAPLPTV